MHLKKTFVTPQWIKVAFCSFAAVVLVSFLIVAEPAAHSAAAPEPANFLFATSSNLQSIMTDIKRPDIDGVQVVYPWKELEPKKDEYNFSPIENDLRVLTALHKKLFIQVQDRFFEPNAKNVPEYLLKNPIYGGGLTPQVDHPGQGKPPTMGWATEQWNPNVCRRYQRLLQALGARFDGRVYGVNLPETAIDIDRKHDKTGFSCNKYFDAEMENLGVAKEAFQKSYVVQYVNFWPCGWNNDHNYMGRLFAYAAKHKIGLGGPDVVPYKRTQMKNSYQFFHRYKGKLVLVAMAVQGATLTYTNPKTRRPFTKREFQDFAKNYLGAKIIFWTPNTPWLEVK